MKLPHIFSNALLVTTFFILSCSTSFLVEANNGGLTVDLIHRDSPKSPFYNPFLTPSLRLKNAFRHSMVRTRQLASASVIPTGGEYLMKISYGIPPFETLEVVDTGSDLTWTQCLPCTNCPKKNFPRFNPKSSSTFEFVPCTSKTCEDFSSSMCGQTYTTCVYYVYYADTSNTHGDLANETINLEGSIGEKVSFPDFVFGCAQDGNFPEEESGTVGLGVGKQSLISQLSNSIRGQFSYCFGPSTDVSKPGKIRFGDNPLIFGQGMVSMPVYLDYSYSLRLEAISVANTTLKYHYNDEPSSSSGNIIIDSGTLYTLLPTALYTEFESTIKREIGYKKVVDDPVYDSMLCYSSLLDCDIPKITLHFAGADLKLNAENIFVRYSKSAVCLGVVPYDVAILGNIAQANFWVGYDLENRIVSFKRADCTMQ